jgi:Zn-finger nucleic acid-binding protein
MSRMNFGKRSGIMVDACKADGTWFDKGELEATLNFVRSGGLALEAPPHRPTEAALGGEAARLVKTMTATLEQERQNDAASVAEATGFIDDLLFIIAPGDRHWAWGRRRNGR